MATRYSRRSVRAIADPAAAGPGVAPGRAPWLAAWWLFVLLFGVNAAAQTPASVLAGAASRAEHALLAARKAWQTQPTNAEAAWVVGRACFDCAEFATNDTQRAAFAEEGIAACRPAAKNAPELAPAHYYLAMNLGQLARTKMLGALRLVGEMEREFKTARGLDPKFDHAGADRCLGLLYRDAPGWPTSVGDKAKARLHLQRAVELVPDYPDNRLCLLEAALRWRDWKLVERETAALGTLLPAARKQLAGEAWEASWVDWDQRWARAQTKAQDAKRSRPSQAP